MMGRRAGLVTRGQRNTQLITVNPHSTPHYHWPINKLTETKWLTMTPG